MADPQAPLDEQALTRRFLLELWLEPRDVVTQFRTMRGRVRELAEDPGQGRERAVVGPADVDAFVRECFRDAPSWCWEAET